MAGGSTGLGTYWRAGGTISYADIAVGSHIATAKLADVTPDLGQYRHLTAWCKKLDARPTYQTMMDQTRDFIARVSKP